MEEEGGDEEGKELKPINEGRGGERERERERDRERERETCKD